MLVDANVLLYAVDPESARHDAAVAWLNEQLNGDRRVGLPWAALSGFLRIATSSRVFNRPLPPDVAWQRIRDWLDADVTWTPGPTDRHAEIFGRLVTTHAITGNLTSDAHLAAIAIEHGLTVCSVDTDFARFPEIRWLDPLR
jgi:toxin-antitoxin system PIN domain toxin